MIPNVSAHPLAGVWLKITRAREHLKTLCDEISRLRPEQVPWTIAQEFDPTDNSWVVRVDDPPQLPLHWGPLSGDMAHNYRSALHALAFELAFLDQGGKECPGSSFPLVASEHWADPAIQTSIQHLSTDHQALVKASQPDGRTDEHGRPQPLLILAGLANDDKHRVVQPAHFIPVEFHPWFDPIGFNCYMVPGVIPLSTCLYRVLDRGTEIYRIPLVVTGPNPKMEVKVQLTGIPALRNTIAIDGVFKVIDRLVVEIVERFVPSFETREAIALRGRERVGRFTRRDVGPYDISFEASLFVEPSGLESPPLG